MSGSNIVAESRRAQDVSMSIFGAMRIHHLLLTVFLCACCISGFGQSGQPFMTEIELNRQFSDSRIGSIVQDDEESMYFSTSRGVLKYDGSRWMRISTPSPALRVFYHDVSKRVFIGLKHGAVELLKSDSGTYVVQEIPGISTTQPISQILSSDGSVFFIGESEIFVKNSLTTAPAQQSEFSEMLITGSFMHDKELYLLFFRDGLFKWNQDNLKMVGDYSSIAEEQMLFSFSSSKGTFVGFESDRLYRFDDNRLTPVKEHLQNFLSENLLSDGCLLNDSLMALSTLAGGAVVANVNSYDIQYKFDYSSGAKDNEIFCLGTDKDKGLWLAYEEGLTRVDLLQPVRSFGAYPGLEGNITSSLMANGKLHVGTGNGVFVLDKATSKAEMRRMLNQMIQKRESSKAEQRAAYVPPPQPKVGATKKESVSLIERYKENPEEVKQELSKKEIRELKKELRRQRKEARKNKKPGEVIEDFFKGNSSEDSNEEIPETSGPNTKQNLIPNPTSGPSGSGMTAPPGSGNTKRNRPQVLSKAKAAKEVEAQHQKLKELSNSYLFRKVEGIDVKCRQIVQLGTEVFAATNNGLFVIGDGVATNLTPDLYINHVSRNSDGSKLLLATVKGVYVLSKTEQQWLATALNDTIQFVAYNAIEDNQSSIWASTDNGAFRYFLDEVKYYPLPDVMNERVLVADVYGNVHFLLPNALYHYIPDSDTILPASLPDVPTSGRLEYMLGENEQVWIRSAQGWHILNGDNHISMLPYLDLFEDVRHLNTDADGNIYVVDKGQHIYSLEHQSSATAYNFNAYIRQVANANGEPFAMGDTKIITEDGSLIFSVSAPFYLKDNGTEYQWQIEGLRSWSRWSEETEIDPGNIPPGEYNFQVRARNFLGEVSKTRTLSFTVPKPIYLRWYALLFYAVVLTLMILGVIKYRERSLRETQRILEKEVEKRTTDLARAKEKTEELLLNILPRETADELQKNGKATARHYNNVSVLFTDFKGFTNFAENTPPEKLVDELHRYFVKFDAIIDKYHIEKIKTIGDAYMCAGGVPIRNSSNPIAITLAALEIRDFMEKVSAEKRAAGELTLDIRIGIHTGPLTAGVVGMKKFAYDIWGDTVNTASRMESASEPGRINVSGTTYELIKKYFETEYRGQKEAKGKGLVEMYFVNAIKPDFSKNGNGNTPNQLLLELVS